MALEMQGQQLAAHVQQCVEWERNHREQASGRFVDMQVQITGVQRAVSGLVSQLAREPVP